MKTKVRLNAFIRSLFFNNLMVTKRYSVSQILKIEIFLVLYSGKISIFVATIMEVVAQLVRASVCGTEGRGFETRLPPKKVPQRDFFILSHFQVSGSIPKVRDRILTFAMFNYFL